MIVCGPSLLVLYPSIKLVCFFVPCAILLGMLVVYMGGLLNHYTVIAVAKINDITNGTSF